MLSEEEKRVLESIGLTKVCKKCGEIKVISDYQKEQSGVDGLRTTCKQCQSKYNKVYGQKNKDILRAQRQKRRQEYPYESWSYRTKCNHAGKGFTLLMTLEDIMNLAQKSTHCEICGDMFDWFATREKGSICTNSPTLDRVNNETTLTLQNVQIICSRCNLTKSDRTMTEFIDYCRLVVKRFN